MTVEFRDDVFGDLCGLEAAGPAFMPESAAAQVSGPGTLGAPPEPPPPARSDTVRDGAEVKLDKGDFVGRDALQRPERKLGQ